MKAYFGEGDTLDINGKFYRILFYNHGTAECLPLQAGVEPDKIVLTVYHYTSGKTKYLYPLKQKLLQFFLRTLSK